MFRLDRLATLYCFYPLKKIKSSNEELRIPILMYHSISAENENGVHPYYQTTTSPAVFNEHMKYLYDNNYSAITLSETVSLLKNQSVVHSIKPQTVNLKPLRYVVLTFDDGFRDFYTTAYPILKKYGFTASIFLATGFIDNKEAKFKGKECLRWTEIKELRKAGVSFGSHTVTHPQLKQLGEKDIEYELKKSKETIEEQIGEQIEAFSYPYKFPDEDKEFKTFLRNMLEVYGYRFGISTRIGTAMEKDNTFFLKRIPVNYCDDIPFFKAKLEGGYNWLYALQYFIKKSRLFVR